MKQNIIRTLAIAASTILIVASCKNAAVNADAENDVKFDSISADKQYYLLGDTANPHCTVKVDFTYPTEYRDKAVLGKIQRQFINAFWGESGDNATPQQAIDAYADKYISDYKNLERDFREEIEKTGKKPDKESWFDYYETSSNGILYNKRNILSFSVRIEYFTGGAHGGHSLNNYAINLLTGDSIKERDIFVDGYQDELAQIIVDAIAADKGAANPAELENMGFFSVKEIYPNNNFYIDDKGITYTYNEYEIAPYFVGATSVTLPYDKIHRLVRENSPVAPFLAGSK